MPYTLFCTVLGHGDLFPVKVDETQSVDELKTKIRTKKVPEFNHFAVDRLTLYKIKVDFPNENEYDDIMRKVSEPGYVFDPKLKLIPTFKMLKYFEQGPEGDIHILVELPQGKSIDP